MQSELHTAQHEYAADELADLCQNCAAAPGIRWAGAYRGTFCCDDCAEVLDRHEAEYNNRRWA